MNEVLHSLVIKYIIKFAVQYKHHIYSIILSHVPCGFPTFIAEATIRLLLLGNATYLYCKDIEWDFATKKAINISFFANSSAQRNVPR